MKKKYLSILNPVILVITLISCNQETEFIEPKRSLELIFITF